MRRNNEGLICQRFQSLTLVSFAMITLQRTYTLFTPLLVIKGVLAPMQTSTQLFLETVAILVKKGLITLRIILRKEGCIPIIL